MRKKEDRQEQIDREGLEYDHLLPLKERNNQKSDVSSLITLTWMRIILRFSQAKLVEIQAVDLGWPDSDHFIDQWGEHLSTEYLTLKNEINKPVLVFILTRWIFTIFKQF